MGYYRGGFRLVERPRLVTGLVFKTSGMARERRPGGSIPLLYRRMTSTERIARVRAHLDAIVGSSPRREVVYRSEWLGHVPFGAYHWIERDGTDVSAGLPDGWERNDLLELEHAGFLERIAAWRDPADEWAVRITFRVQAAHPSPA